MASAVDRLSLDFLAALGDYVFACRVFHEGLSFGVNSWQADDVRAASEVAFDRLACVVVAEPSPITHQAVHDLLVAVRRRIHTENGNGA